MRKGNGKFRTNLTVRYSKKYTYSPIIGVLYACLAKQERGHTTARSWTVCPVFVQHLFVQRLFVQSFSSNPFRPILLGLVRLGLDKNLWTKIRWTKVNWTKSRSTEQNTGYERSWTPKIARSQVLTNKNDFIQVSTWITKFLKCNIAYRLLNFRLWLS